MSIKPLSSLSIFFPAYNDEHTVESLTKACIEVAGELTDDYEILIVDDHSPDGTGAAADRMAAEYPAVRAIHHERNLGVGQAMITGFTQSKKDYVFYTDGDAQYDVNELKTFVPYVKDYDVLIGYRLKRAEGFKRIFTSRCFHLLNFLLFAGHFKDIDCSFKLLHRRFLEQIKFRTKSALVDPEILIQARKFKFPVKEIGVHHYSRKFGQSQCLRIRLIFSMILDLVRLRFIYWFL